jgi:glycosyltransferase involved in cell wall biosynthesis
MMAGVPVVTFPLRGEHSLPTWWRFARWLCERRRITPSLIVHAHSRRGALPTLLIARWLKLPTILHWRVAAPLPRWLVPLADQVIAVSEASARAAMQAGIATDRIAVVRSAIEPDHFTPHRDARQQERIRWGLAKHAFVVAGVGRLVAGKGYEVVLDALAAMNENERPILLLAGDGPLGPSLEQMVDRWRLGLWVRFVGFQDDVRAVLWAADAFVHVPTHFPEGTPNAILEAMAACLPVIATPVGGTGEIVEPDRTGLLVPPGDTVALVEALRRLRADPAERHRLGAAA